MANCKNDRRVASGKKQTNRIDAFMILVWISTASSSFSFVRPTAIYHFSFSMAFSVDSFRRVHFFFVVFGVCVCVRAQFSNHVQLSHIMMHMHWPKGFLAIFYSVGVFFCHSFYKEAKFELSLVAFYPHSQYSCVAMKCTNQRNQHVLEDFISLKMTNMCFTW